MDKLRILTNNVWSCGSNRPWWRERGLDCSSKARAPKFAPLYKETMPDLIGWQESDKDFCEIVPPAMKELGMNFELIPAGCTSILYNKDKLELRESRFCIYPDTMEGFDGVYNEVNTKSYGIGVFKIIESGKHLVFGTTHLWWKSGDPSTSYYCPQADEGREFQINCMLDELEILRKKYNCPAIAVGDLNAEYDSLAVNAVFARGYRHAHDIAKDFADEREGHHFCTPSGYNMYESPKPFKKGIDHIFVKGEPEGSVKRFERYTPEYYMPLSDHFPAFIDLEF